MAVLDAAKSADGITDGLVKLVAQIIWDWVDNNHDHVVFHTKILIFPITVKLSDIIGFIETLIGAHP